MIIQNCRSNAVDKIEVGGVVLDQRGKKGSDTKIVIKGAPRSINIF